MRHIPFLFLIISFSINLFAQDEDLTRLLRFPDICKEKIAFVYAGDIWIVDANGGTARQLTYYSYVGPMPPRGGYDYRVLDWTPDGKNVLFRANRLPWSERMGKYFTV